MSTATREQKDKYENSRAWRWLRSVVIAANPICQAIVNGEQCHSPANVVHHLIAPEDWWEGRNVIANLCAVCANHHAGGARGDNARQDYVPTREVLPMGGGELLHHHTRASAHANRQLEPDVAAALAAIE